MLKECEQLYLLEEMPYRTFLVFRCNSWTHAHYHTKNYWLFFCQIYFSPRSDLKNYEKLLHPYATKNWVTILSWKLAPHSLPMGCKKIKTSAFPIMGEAIWSGPRRSAIPRPNPTPSRLDDPASEVQVSDQPKVWGSNIVMRPRWCLWVKFYYGIAKSKVLLFVTLHKEIFIS